MVRQIVGALAEVGRGSLTPAEVDMFLTDESDAPAKLTAPPSGLFLERVYYPGDARLEQLEPLLIVES
jgi:tRNA pseudouridine38-40 synthase